MFVLKIGINQGLQAQAKKMAEANLKNDLLKQAQKEEAQLKEQAGELAKQAQNAASSGDTGTARALVAQALGLGVDVPGLSEVEQAIEKKQGELDSLKEKAKEKIKKQQKLAEQQEAKKLQAKSDTKKADAKEAAKAAVVAQEKTTEELKKQEAKKAEKQMAAKIKPPPLGGSPEAQMAQLLYNKMAGVVLNSLENPLTEIGLDDADRKDALATNVTTPQEDQLIEMAQNSPEYDAGARIVMDNLVKQMIMNGVPAEDLEIAEKAEIERIGMGVEANIA